MSRKSQHQYFTEAIVGIFMIAVILMLAYFTIVISGVDVLRGNTKVEVLIAFDQVGGLKDHDSVMYRGTKVGVVEFVDVTPSNLVVHANIDRKVILRDGYEATVRNFSMLGGNYLHLDEGAGAILPLETTVFHGSTPTDWMQDMKKVANNIKRFSEMSELRSIVTNIEATTQTLRTIVDRVERGEGTIGKLLSNDDSVYNDIKDTVADAKATFKNAKDISAKLDRQQTFDDLEAGVAAFRKAAEGIDFKETMARANQLLDNLNAVSEKLRNGDGTLGKLANNPELYDRLNALLKDARQVLDNYRDTTPISTFTSIAAGAL